MNHRISLFVTTLMILGAILLTPANAGAEHDIGPDAVYFPQTGHTLRDSFLSHWRHYGGLTIFGFPLTEAVSDPQTGVTRQYFERAVFDLNPEGEGAWAVLLHRLGAQLVEGRQSEQPFRPIPNWAADNCTYFEVTQHRVCNGFRDFWEDHGGLPTFGYPLSEEFSEKNPDTGQVYTVQYFERARFEWHPEYQGTPHEVLLGRLGAQAAAVAGVDIKPAPQPEDVKTWDPGLWYVPAPPEPEPPAVLPPDGAPTWVAKWIEVDLSAQYMSAWEYDTLVLGTYVSTGTWDYPTPTGTFWIFYKLRYDDMTNGLAAPPGEYYYVEDVPHVMYFLEGGYAIHGAYWHNMFGTPYSHGCVSAPLWAAEWFYNWAPYGTRVWIHW